MLWMFITKTFFLRAILPLLFPGSVPVLERWVYELHGSILIKFENNIMSFYKILVLTEQQFNAIVLLLKF